MLSITPTILILIYIPAPTLRRILGTQMPMCLNMYMHMQTFWLVDKPPLPDRAKAGLMYMQTYCKLCC